ncbi:uncharacterized protein LOC106647473 [Copidosoma floridanum]|uniref:uncharacterized protein LOC106647473 n=1 Tax=Copidosoma floridanum TaxID=29053 RepID=UPI0006C94B80|nr:uncharacterized protein LOC106647473 [Copidosoma floridanum]
MYVHGSLVLLKFQLCLRLLLVTALTIRATVGPPLARIRVRFVQPPYIQEHGLTTDGARIVEQQSYLSVARRSSTLLNSGSGYPTRSGARYLSQRPDGPRFIERNDLSAGEGGFSHGLGHPDPLLLIGEAALIAVKYLYGRGELFFSDVPHERAVLRHQELRKLNGLNGNVLGSLRPSSPWYRWDDGFNVIHCV